MPVVKETLSAQSLACIEKLKALNLSPIAAYLMNPQNGGGWSRQQTLQAIGRYKTFLFVSYLYPDILLVPTQEIDRVWHSHILHTRKYRQDCEGLFGYFIEHQPDSEYFAQSKGQNLDAAFVQTQSFLVLFQKYFETDTSAESLLPPDQAFNLPQEKVQSVNEADPVNVHLHRSACGRPQPVFAE